jgi:ATP-GRASP peptide maturase of grasp-with-spasm system
MILIISEDTDVSTDCVIDWIGSLGGNFFRINQSDRIEHILRTKDGQSLITVKGTAINLNDITCFWHRRADLSYEKYEQLDEPIFEKEHHLCSEWLAIKEYLLYKLREKPRIANFNPHINKLIVLEEARKTGLHTPSFIICDQRTDIFSSSVTKAISNAYNIDLENAVETFYTEDLEKIEHDEFFVSMIQEKIYAKYEVRTVFVKGCCWSMAIHNFSNTTDYRKNYDKLRYSPYKLPTEIEAKFIQLCNALQIDFCAADFIVDKENHHYFLEINPSGQYGMVADPCNYPIDEEIAKTLVNYDQRNHISLDIL